MAGPTGIYGQFGHKTESTPGTPVTVDTFHPGLLSGARIRQDITPIWSKGIRAGRHTRAAVKQGAKPVDGRIPLELWSEPSASLLRHMFGVCATTGSGPYTHTASPGDLTGLSFTGQLGLPDLGGTVRAVTAAGCKVAQWTLEAEAESTDPAKLDLDIVGMSTTTATALAAASYGSGEPFTWVEASLSIGGSADANVKKVTLSGDNKIDGRFRLNDANSKEPLQTATAEFTGTVVADFADLTHYDRFINGTPAALVLTLSNGTDSLTITCNVWFDGETPELDEGTLEQPLPFTCYHPTLDASAITAVLVNGESSSA